MSTVNNGPQIVKTSLAFVLDPTVSAGFIKTPKQISDCITWFDADDLSTITTESGSRNVRYWADKSASNLTLTGGGLTLANEPLSVIGGLNGRNTMRFDGGDYIYGSFATSYTEFTVFLVINADTSSPPIYQYPFTIANNINTTNAFYFDINDPDGSNFAQTLWVYWNSGGSPYSILPRTSPNTTSDFVQGSPTLITFSHTNAGSGTNTIYINGRARADQSNSGTQTITIGGSGQYLFMGARATSVAGPYKGDIGELIIYSRQLSSTERKQVEYYLSNKWRIQSLQTTLTNKDLIFGKLTTCQNNNIPSIDKSYRLNPADATGSPKTSNFYFADSVSWLSSLITTTITMEAWVKPNSFAFGGNNTDLGTIMIANSNFYLSIDGNGKFNAFMYGSAGSTVNHQPSTTSVTRHAWNHIVWTFDGAYIRWYLNGVLDKTSSTTFTIGTINLTQYLGIGAEGLGTYGRMLDGYVAGCKIYGKPLTAAEISQNYESSKTEFSNLPNIITSNLNIYLDADIYSSYVGSGTTWTDLSGNGYNFTMYSSQTATAFSYNQNEPKTFTLSRSSNNWSRLSSGGTITLGSNETVSFWINTTGASANSQYGLFSHCSGGPVNLAYGMANNKMIYWYYDTTWNTKSSTASINDGTWKHITWVKTGGTTMNMYINGVLDSTHTITNVSGPVNTVGALWGPCDGTPSYSQLFDGKIANFMHYNIGLTADQVLQNYNAQKHRFGK